MLAAFILLIAAVGWLSRRRTRTEGLQGSLQADQGQTKCPRERCPAGCAMPAWVTSDCSEHYDDGMGVAFSKCPYLCKAGEWDCAADRCCQGCGHALFRKSSGVSRLTPDAVFGLGTGAAHDLKRERLRAQDGDGPGPGRLSPGPGDLPAAAANPPQPAPLTLYSMTPIHQATAAITEGTLIQRTSEFDSQGPVILPPGHGTGQADEPRCRASATGIFRDCGPVGAGPNCLG